MCTFYDTLPKQSKSIATKKRNLVLSMKPCADEKTFYRFRLLAFSGMDGSDRDFPWIQRFMHVKWGKHPEKGYPMIIDSVTCPVTPHVHVEGNRYNACKMCEVANQYFIRFKESGWKDKEASKKNKEFGRKLEYNIPVYVVNDPNYEGNNGKFKVIQITDKKFFEEFKSRVEKQSHLAPIFNGKAAVDCCMHVSEVKEVKNEGLPNEYTWKHKVIDKIIFSNRPYEIPSINKETVDAMGFDEEFYTSSTPEEINAFYKRWCTVSNDDLPEDDMAIPVYSTTQKKDAQPVKVSNDAPNVKANDDLSDADFDAVVGDVPSKSETSVDDIPVDGPEDAPAASNDASSSEIEALLDGIDI